MSAIPASTVRRLTATLFAAQVLSLAAGFTWSSVASLTGVALTGSEQVAGLPSTFMLVGGALAAYPAGRVMSRAGRRVGLSAGYACGILGGSIAGLGVIAGMMPALLFGTLLLGAARAISDQSRYAAADVAPVHLRARAVSAIVFAGTVGAIGGRVLLPIAGQAAESLGYDELVGPWFVAAVLFVAALILINLLLHPDPRDVAWTLQPADALEHRDAVTRPARSFRQVMSLPSARLALISLGLAQMVMVMLMTITPVHMQHFGHGLGDIGSVLLAHVVGMFGLSIVTGWLTDRWGQRATIGLGGLLLIASCALAPQNPDTLPLAVSLFLLGLGWNMCFVSGSSLLTNALAIHERARIQGAADLVVYLASATGSLGSGLLIASLGFGTLATIGAGVALIVSAAALKSQRPQPVKVAAAN